MSSSVSNTLSKFSCIPGEFGINDEIAYKKALYAQNIADSNGDKKLSDNEIEIFDALKTPYGTPEIGGVKIDSLTLTKIEHISKNDDGNYVIQFKPENKIEKFIFSPQDKTKQAKFSAENPTKLEFATNETQNKIDNLG